MAKKSSLFIRQSVIGLGFLSGLFLAIGADPQDEIIRVIGSSVHTVYPDPQVSYLFYILPAVLLLVSVTAAYLKGGVLGLFSVFIAYFSGLSVLVSLPLALALVAIAVLFGYLATSRRLKLVKPY